MFIDRIMRKSEVIEVTGIAPGSLWHIMKTGQFPKSVKTSKRTMGWRQSEVQAWLNEVQKNEIE